jgi:hypothetical protein
MTTLGHELVHSLRRDAPALYDELVEALRPYINSEEYAARMGERRTGAWADLSDDKLREEFIGDVVADGFLHPTAFWKAVGEASPTLFKRVITALRVLVDVARRALGSMYVWRTRDMLNDFEGALRAAGTVFAQYRGGEGEAGGPLHFQQPLFTVRRDGLIGAGVQAWNDATTSHKVLSALSPFQTQLHKALTIPQFRPVYQAVQRFLQDTSRFANDAADRAGDLLPRLSKWGDVFSLKPFSKQFKADVAAAGKATFLGTLGKVRPTLEQLRDGFTVTHELDGVETEYQVPPLSASAIEVWKQSRAALDLSLDQTAMSEMVRLTKGDRIDAARAAARLNPEGARQIMLDALTPQLEQLTATAAEARRQANVKKAAVVRLREAVKAEQDDAAKAALRVQRNAAGKAFGAADGMARTAERARDAKQASIDAVNALADRAQQLRDEGYAPLMRFGDFSVDVTEEGDRPGDVRRLFFGMYETQTEANRAARKMQELYPTPR